MGRRGWLAAMAVGAACLSAWAGGAVRTAVRPEAGTVIEGMPRGLKDPVNPIRPEGIPKTLIKDPQGVLLSIPARDQAPERPPEGWCGETAIQEALLYHGAYLPQKQINAAGKPDHPDLYSYNIPVALENLRMAFQSWPPPGNTDLAAFLAWVREQISQGVPVLAGVKINPTKHPEWGLDHFVTAVGLRGDSILFNTTWGKQEVRTEKQLCSTEDGYSFKNLTNRYYGIAITGPAGLGPEFVPVRLFVVKEDAAQMAVVVKCEGLQPRTRYVAYKISSYDQKSARPLAVFESKGDACAFGDVIPRAEPAIYRCRKAPAP